MHSEMAKQSQITASLLAQVQAVHGSAGLGGPVAGGGLESTEERTAAALRSSRKLQRQQRRSAGEAVGASLQGRDTRDPVTGGLSGIRLSSGLSRGGGVRKLPERPSDSVNDRIVELTSLPLYNSRRSASPEGGGGIGMNAHRSRSRGRIRGSPPNWQADFILYTQRRHPQRGRSACCTPPFPRCECACASGVSHVSAPASHAFISLIKPCSSDFRSCSKKSHTGQAKQGAEAVRSIGLLRGRSRGGRRKRPETKEREGVTTGQKGKEEGAVSTTTTALATRGAPIMSLPRPSVFPRLGAAWKQRGQEVYTRKALALQASRGHQRVG